MLTTLSRRALLALTAVLAPRFARAQEPLRYLALGDSFTIGTGSSEAEAFPARLRALLVKAGVDVRLWNVAVNGYSTQEVIDEELPALAAVRPRLVTLAVGANDLVRRRDARGYRENLKIIFAALAAAQVPPRNVLVLPQPDWSKAPVAKAFGPPEKVLEGIVAFNQVLAEVATEAKALYVDLFPLMQAQAAARRFAPDGLHPAAEAHLAWAVALLPKVLERVATAAPVSATLP